MHYILFITPPWVWLDLRSTFVLTPFLIFLQRKTQTSFPKTLSRGSVLHPTLPVDRVTCGWVGVAAILLFSDVRPWSFDTYHNGRQTVQYPPSFPYTNIFVLSPYTSWWMLVHTNVTSDDARRRQFGVTVFHEPRINPQAHRIPL